MITLSHAPRRRPGFTCLLLAVGLAACATLPKSSPPKTALEPEAKVEAKPSTVPTLSAELPPREELPFEAREMLASRMLRHGEQMTALMVGVLFLDYELTQRLAEDLASEPKLGRPAPNERGTLNALLPAGFFVHQDALADSARALARAAQLGDDQKIVEAFGTVAKSCVGCHSTYLHDELNMNFEHQEPDEPDCEAGDDCSEAPARDPHQTRQQTAPAKSGRERTL